jgi:formylglycine-generating enzyme required for sulfatase activity
MGKYPITRSQWCVVAGFPQVNRELNPSPPIYKDDNRPKRDERPVEYTSWNDATEFCARLSQLTRRDYRLPSEAEWEYACRASTTSPFHFGETITPELANYDWDKNYAAIEVAQKKDFEGTTPVGQFRVANAFGLYDMHGNVWEWCLDHWHSSYEGAPTDGSAWLSDKKDANRVLRGGSWIYDPRYCRSAVHRLNTSDDSFFDFGFRVVCSANRILQVTVNSVEPKDRTNITQS